MVSESCDFYLPEAREVSPTPQARISREASRRNSPVESGDETITRPRHFL